MDEFYQWHKDYVLEIFFKTRAYNEGYYRSLIDDFGLKKELSEREMKLLIFGNYTEHEELGKRPLAKLTKDIMEQIGIGA